MTTYSRTVMIFGPDDIIPRTHPVTGQKWDGTEYLPNGFSRAFYDGNPPRHHEARDPLTNTCLYCYSKIKPGPQAQLITDYDRPTTTTGGV